MGRVLSAVRDTISLEKVRRRKANDEATFLTRWSEALTTGIVEGLPVRVMTTYAPTRMLFNGLVDILAKPIFYIR